jgi:hypothetical protein
MTFDIGFRYKTPLHAGWEAGPSPTAKVRVFYDVEHGIRVELADGIPDSRVATARFVPRYSGWTLMIHNVFC